MAQIQTLLFILLSIGLIKISEAQIRRRVVVIGDGMDSTIQKHQLNIVSFILKTSSQRTILF